MLKAVKTSETVCGEISVNMREGSRGSAIVNLLFIENYSVQIRYLKISFFTIQF